MNTTEDRETVPDNTAIAESIDLRLHTIREILDRIYRDQEMLLQPVHPELREDFIQARLDRIRELANEEIENYTLLKTWTHP